jgi:1-deoxy-D-xylulose-5-phosphate reductoisomerase
VRVGQLEFFDIDHERFPAVRLAYEAGRAGGTHPAVLNAANEVAVQAFVSGRLRFRGITDVIGQVLEDYDRGPASSLGAVLEADAWARARTAATIGGD